MTLSIIIPCYNSARFISSTLEMLLLQRLDDCEVIVVNDGSTDNTSAIVHEYALHNSCIKIIDKENEGVSVARNTGINAACGDYVYFLDSDDKLEDGTIEFFKKSIQTYSSLPMYAFGYVTEKDSNLLKNYSVPNLNDKVMDKALLTESFFTKKLSVNICSSIYERNFLNQYSIRFTPGVKIGEDVEFILRALLQAHSLYYNSRICFKYQIRDDSTMQGYKTYKTVNSWITNKEIIDELGQDEYKLFYNYWLINRYIGKLYVYLRYGKKSETIKETFINTKYFLSLPTKNYGKIYFLSRILKIFPMKLLFLLFRK